MLIGNHESMNMIGDLRYVSKAEYAAFAEDETSEQRERWFNAWLRRSGGTKERQLEKFDSEFPAGFFALREAFGPDGVTASGSLRRMWSPSSMAPRLYTVGSRRRWPTSVWKTSTASSRQDLIDYVNAVATLMEAEILLPTDWIL